MLKISELVIKLEALQGLLSLDLQKHDVRLPWSTYILLSKIDAVHEGLKDALHIPIDIEGIENIRQKISASMHRDLKDFLSR